MRLRPLLRYGVDLRAGVYVGGRVVGDESLAHNIRPVRVDLDTVPGVVGYPPGEHLRQCVEVFAVLRRFPNRDDAEKAVAADGPGAVGDTRDFRRNLFEAVEPFDVGIIFRVDVDADQTGVVQYGVGLTVGERAGDRERGQRTLNSCLPLRVLLAPDGLHPLTILVGGQKIVQTYLRRLLVLYRAEEVHRHVEHVPAFGCFVFLFVHNR